MVLAYLRGLLKPDYAHGVTSVIRERVVLMALGNEAQIGVVLGQLLAQASFAPILRADAAQDMYKKMAESFTHLLQKAELNLLLAPPELSKKSRAMLQLFEHLQKTSFFEQLNKVSERALRKAGFDLDAPPPPPSRPRSMLG